MGRRRGGGDASFLRSVALPAKGIALLAAVASLAAGNAHGQYRVLHDFGGLPADGYDAVGDLILVGDALYGVTYCGGSSDHGTIYSLHKDGSGYKLLYRFTIASKGYYPSGGLVSDGVALYGTAQYGGLGGGSGVVFAYTLNPPQYDVLYDFSGGPADGSEPRWALTLHDGTLYGTTQSGGSNDDGVVFSVNTDGSNSRVIHHFAGSPDDGEGPSGRLHLDGDTLYGMTCYGGKYFMGMGTVFSMKTDGTGFTLLHSFGDSDVGFPLGGLHSGGNALYGVCGGGMGWSYPLNSAVFSLSRDGSGFTVLHRLEGDEESSLWTDGGLVQRDGILYGMTVPGDRHSADGGAVDAGTICAMALDGSGFRTIHRFDGLYHGTGCLPVGGLLSDGSTLYGATYGGGSSARGVVFSLPIPPTPAPTATPQAEIVLNAPAFRGGDRFAATFRLNGTVARPFTAYAVFVVPGGGILNARPLGGTPAPVAGNIPRLDAPFEYPLIDATVPPGTAPGEYELAVAFFDPSRPAASRADAFMEASARFGVGRE